MRRLIPLLLVLLCTGTFAPPALAAEAQPGTSAALRAKYAALKERLANSPFHRPLVLDSREQDGTLEGDVYAVIAHSFPVVRQALVQAHQWCEVLFLHLNVQYCGTGSDSGQALVLHVGRKYFEPLGKTYRLKFSYRVEADTVGYMEIQLRAPNGPMGTSDYRMSLQGIPLDATHSFLHFQYSYAYGLTASLATKAYLMTLGSGKVGFTVVGTKSNGEPEYIDGLRGIVERNVMRYYLAIEAYLKTLSLPPADRVEARLREWFLLTERYPRQLHELDEDEYLEYKREEYQREQQAR